MELSEVWLIGSMIGYLMTDDELREILSRQDVYTGKEQEQEESRDGFDVQQRK